MPSLNDLQQFKASFHDIGGQKADLLAKNLPFDDLELPTAEPEAAAQPDEAESAQTAGAPADEPSQAGAESSSAGEDSDFDFGTLIGTQLGDLPDSAFADGAQAEGQDGENQNAEEFYAPQELLSNLSEELAATPPDFPDDAFDGFEADDNQAMGDSWEDAAGLDPAEQVFADEMPGDSAGSENDGPGSFGSSEGLAGEDDVFGGLDGFDLPSFPDDSAETESGGLDLDDLGDFGLSEGPLAAGGQDDDFSSLENDGFNLDDLGDFGLSDDSLAPSAQDDGLSGDESGDFDVGSLGDFDPAGDPFTPDGQDGDFSLDSLDDFGLSDEQLVADGQADGDFDAGSLGDFDPAEDPFMPDGQDGDFNLDNLGDFGLSDEPLAADGQADDGFDAGSLGDFDPGEDPFMPDGQDGDFDLDNLGDFGLSDEPLAADGQADGGFDASSLGDFDPVEDPFMPDGQDGDFSLDNLDDFGLSDESSAADGQADASSDAESGDSDIDNLGDFGLSGEPLVADGPADDFGGAESGDFDGFDFPGEPFAADGPPETGSDDFGDGLDFSEEAASGGDPSSNGIGDFAAISGDEPDAFGDFAFPDLDDVLDAPKAPVAKEIPEEPAPSGKLGGFWGRGKTDDAPPPPKSLEEISISEGEFKDLQRTLSDYPLNLRIACQEVIVEQDVSPEKMSRLIANLVQGAPAKETAALVSDILGKTIAIPKGFEKSSGEALEAEKGTFAYAFTKTFLPVLRMVAIIAVLAASTLYLAYTFVFIPIRAELIYRSGYERIFAGDYQLANERFRDAFDLRRSRNWFYRYAEAFVGQRQFAHAVNKYEMLLHYFPRDRRGVLDFAALLTNHLHNYERADNLLRRQILDFNPNDEDALLAAGDNSLAWAEIDPSRFEDARISFARLLELQGWTPPVVERMLRYFIRTDDLGQVLYLMDWFDENPRRNMQAATLAELGGYLLDKQSEETRGVPNEFLGQIRGVPEILREAMRLDPSLPEPYYHLARFYHGIGQSVQERGALEYAIRAFELAPEGSPRRIRYHIDARQRYADVLIHDRAFFDAEAQLVRAVNLYEDGIRRNILTPSQNYGRLFAGLGDLEYFVKTGDMEAALRFYRDAERHGWAPPEMRFRMGVAYYQLENWGNALEHFFVASMDLPQNRRVLFALGNSALKRGDYFAAQGFYSRLLNILESHRAQLPILLPNDRPEYLELAERLMMARNNAGVASERLAEQTGDISHRTRAMGLYAEAQRAWDARTRDPATMIRSGSVPLPHLNMRNVLHPQPGFEPQIFIRIDRDALETSHWERIAPQMLW